MVAAGATNVVVEQAGLLSLRFLSRLAFLSILRDRRDRAVGAGAECQRLGTGGVQPFGAVRLRRPRMPMQERNPCSGCGRERSTISTSAATSSPIVAAGAAHA